MMIRRVKIVEIFGVFLSLRSGVGLSKTYHPTQPLISMSLSDNSDRLPTEKGYQGAVQSIFTVLFAT